MTEVFLDNQASEFGLKVHHDREDRPTVRHQGRMSTKGLKNSHPCKNSLSTKNHATKSLGSPSPPPQRKINKMA
jgi:hypothetical protein